MISGYKAFNEDMTNNFGFSFSQGKVYVADGIIRFGIRGNGFHLCRNIEDTLRFFDGMNENIQIAKVNGYGNIDKREDDYYGYYDMYSVEKLEIVKILERKEIIEIADSLNSESFKRFVAGFKLNSDEIEFARRKYNSNASVLRYIDYYQCDDKEAFYRGYK